MSIIIGNNKLVLLCCLWVLGCSDDLKNDLKTHYSDEISPFEMCLPCDAQLLSERMNDFTVAFRRLLRTKGCFKEDVVEILGIDRAKWLNLSLHTAHEIVYDFPNNDMHLAQVRVWFNYAGWVVSVFPSISLGQNVSQAEIMRLSAISKTMQNAQCFGADGSVRGQEDIADAILCLRYEIEQLKNRCKLSMNDILGFMGAPTYCYHSVLVEDERSNWFEGSCLLRVCPDAVLRIVYLYVCKGRPVRIAFTIHPNDLPWEFSVQDGDGIFPDWCFDEPLARPWPGMPIGEVRLTL